MKYELTLVCRSDKDAPFDMQSYDTLLADNLVSLLSQLIVLIATLHRREMEEHGKSTGDDDIPF